MSSHSHLLQLAAESMHPMRCQPPSAWAKAWRALLGSTPNRSEEMKRVPEVPREMLQPPSPTTPVPTAAAALSPAPATTCTWSERPRERASSGLTVPTTS